MIHSSPKSIPSLLAYHIQVRNCLQSPICIRVGEHYKRNLPGEIPLPTALSGNNDWRSVHTAFARFDIYLKQLAKVGMNPNEIQEMLVHDKIWPKTLVPNPYKIFIYSGLCCHTQSECVLDAA